ncbi:alkene reductase [Leptospira kobayashii]|nr:alkene reductase [Leptospira kobayashii]
MTTLFDPVKIGELELSNRIIMAPMTRCRAADNRVPNSLMAEYYEQRASAGMIITEATSVTSMGVGYPDTPGIWSEEQTEAWKKITKAVHDKGGKILLQLWHVGRISDPIYLDGKSPVAPSAIAAEGHVSHIRPKKKYETPRALELDEIPGIVELYRKGAANAKLAGFDGVEIHGANGYLLDQFLQDVSNHRTDIYGGSVENRARLLLEVVDAVVSVWGAGRVGVHLAPKGDAHSMGDSRIKETFSYVVKELDKRKIAFICTRDYVGEGHFGSEIKQLFNGTYIANEKFTKETASDFIASGKSDAVAFGTLFISNPDLVRRFKENLSFNELNSSTIYAKGSEGYTDYPFHS